MTFKQKIHSHYIQLLEKKIKTQRKQISDLAEDAQNDAKGSAGDKHETALSMMHLEQEKLSQKLKEALEQKSILENMNVLKENRLVGIGSLVYTDKFLFFVSAALPQTNIDGTNIISLSLESPIGKVMKGRRVGDEFSFNSTRYTILKIE